MVNAFKVKKYIALFLGGLITPICFFIGFLYYGMLGGIGFFMGGLVISIPLGVVLLKNPFSAMVEGKGILCINLDSTGILNPFIISVSSPYVKGVFKGNNIEDAFDRSTVMQISAPKVGKGRAVTNDEGGIDIHLDEKMYNDGRFALFHYPVIIWNDQIKSIVTKDFLSDKEKDAFSEHGVLYLNRKVEELTSAMRDFGRYVVETLRPKTSLFQSKWFWIIVIVLCVILAALFLPAIYNSVSGYMGSATSNMGSATVTPR